MSTQVGATIRPTGVAGLVWRTALLRRGRDLFQGTAPHHLARLGVVVDFRHAGSMIAVAVKEPTLRGAVQTSGTVAGTAGLLSALAAQTQRKG